TTTTLTSATNPSVLGQAVSFTVTVAPSSGTGTPTGTVAFKEGTTTLDTRTLDSTGSATFSTANLPDGRHAITAVYSGDNTFLGSTSAALNQVVNAPQQTTTTVIPQFNPTRVGLAETFFVTVSGSGGVPTGQVDFVIDGFLSSTQTLDGAGHASFTTSNLDTSFHTLVVNYKGAGAFVPSSNNQFATRANGIKVVADSSTTLASSGLSSLAGQPVTYTATVHASGTVPPNGFVNFIMYFVPVGQSTLNAVGLASVPVGPGGVATFT